MKKHNARIGKNKIKDELHVTEDEVEGAKVAERKLKRWTLSVVVEDEKRKEKIQVKGK
jgi:hypothetical protein